MDRSKITKFPTERKPISLDYGEPGNSRPKSPKDCWIPLGEAAHGVLSALAKKLEESQKTVSEK